MCEHSAALRGVSCRRGAHRAQRCVGTQVAATECSGAQRGAAGRSGAQRGATGRNGPSRDIARCVPRPHRADPRVAAHLRALKQRRAGPQPRPIDPRRGRKHAHRGGAAGRRSPPCFTLYLSFFPLIFILLLRTLNSAAHDDPVKADISLVVPTHPDASCVAEKKHGSGPRMARPICGAADMAHA
jgi:hypothetical protein